MPPLDPAPSAGHQFDSVPSSEEGAMKSNWRMLAVVGLLLLAIVPSGYAEPVAPEGVTCPPTPTPTPPPTGCPLGAEEECDSDEPDFVVSVKNLSSASWPGWTFGNQQEYSFAPDVSSLAVSTIAVVDPIFQASEMGVEVNVTGRVRYIYLANNQTGRLYLLAMAFGSPVFDGRRFLFSNAGPDVPLDPLPSDVSSYGIWSLAVFYGGNTDPASGLHGWAVHLQPEELIGE